MHRQKLVLGERGCSSTLIAETTGWVMPHFAPVAPIFIVSVDWKLETYYCLEI